MHLRVKWRSSYAAPAEWMYTECDRLDESWILTSMSMNLDSLVWTGCAYMQIIAANTVAQVLLVNKFVSPPFKLH